MDKKEEGNICSFCSNNINIKKDHCVQIKTLNIFGKPDDIVYFHIDCWKEYFNVCIENRIKTNLKKLQKKASDIAESPMVSSLLSGIKGTNIISKVLDNLIPKKLFDNGKENNKKEKNEKNNNSYL